MTAMQINSFTYALSVPNTSTTLALRPDITGLRSMIISNSGTAPVFLFTATSGTPTAVFPASGGGPLNGTVILPNTVQTYSCDDTDTVVAAISQSGTNLIFIQFGSGE